MIVLGLKAASQHQYRCDDARTFIQQNKLQQYLPVLRANGTDTPIRQEQ